jgi:hypothetical protein
MPDKTPVYRKLVGVVRVVVGPPALVLMAAIGGVHVTGPATLSLAHPAPALALVVSDVLTVFVLATLALWGASVVAGCRPPLVGFVLPVAASQLPMAAVALLVGRNVLGQIVGRTLASHGEALMAEPHEALAPLMPLAIGVLVLTALAVGVLYVGYRRATNMTGYRLAASFVGGLVCAEVLCRAWFVLAG